MDSLWDAVARNPLVTLIAGLVIGTVVPNVASAYLKDWLDARMKARSERWRAKASEDAEAFGSAVTLLVLNDEAFAAEKHAELRQRARALYFSVIALAQFPIFLVALGALVITGYSATGVLFAVLFGGQCVAPGVMVARCLQLAEAAMRKVDVAAEMRAERSPLRIPKAGGGVSEVWPATEGPKG